MHCLIWNPRFTFLFVRHWERMPVILSAAKGLAPRTERSFAALRMTARTPLKSAHGKFSLQTSTFLFEHLTDVKKYGIIISKYSGIYNIPIIPLVLTCTI